MVQKKGREAEWDWGYNKKWSFITTETENRLREAGLYPDIM